MNWNFARALVICALLLPASAAAQDREFMEDAPHIRRSCDTALSAIRDRVKHSDEAIARHLGNVIYCDRSAAAVLSAMWKERSTLRPQERSALPGPSGSIRDRAIFDAVIEAARDEATDPDLRIGAMRVLARYTDREFGGLFENREVQARACGARFTPSHMTHAWQLEGASPLPFGYGAMIPVVLQGIARTPTDERVVCAAEILASYTRGRVPTVIDDKPLRRRHGHWPNCMEDVIYGTLRVARSERIESDSGRGEVVIQLTDRPARTVAIPHVLLSRGYVRDTVKIDLRDPNVVSIGPREAGTYRLEVIAIGYQPTFAELVVRAGYRDTVVLPVEEMPICDAPDPVDRPSGFQGSS